MEMMNKMEDSINAVMADSPNNLALSALMSASVNCLLVKCNSLSEVIFYREIFVQILDGTIKGIKTQEKPS
jgi:hypothetical protein